MNAFLRLFSNAPALADSRPLRLAVFTTLYSVQGAASGLFLYAFAPYLAERGFSAAAIGSFVGITFLPWSLKLIAGPLMDRWTFLPMGRRRPRVLAGQLGLLIVSVAAAFVAPPTQSLSGLMAAGFMINLFIAFQDVAIDGMAVDLLPAGEQGRANGLMFGGQSAGNAAMLAIGVWMLNVSGPAAVFLMLATLAGITFFMSLLLRERRGERQLPWSSGQSSTEGSTMGSRGIVQQLWRTIILPASLAAVGGLFIYRCGEGLLRTALPVIAVQQLQWPDTTFSQLSAVAEGAAALAGMVVFGFLGDRFGFVRMVKCGAVCVIVLMTAMSFGSDLWSSRVVFSAFVLAYLVTNMMVWVVSVAMMMALCTRRVASTQFALYMAISNWGLAAGAALLGPVTSLMYYSSLFLLVGALYLVMAMMTGAVNLRRHCTRVAELESAEARSPAWLET